MGQKLSIKRSRKHRGPDFSSLPEVVLVNLMQMLNFSDRYRVSRTCRRLHRLMNHPSVWSRVCCSVTSVKSKLCFEMILDRYGPYIQAVTVDLGTFMYSVDKSSALDKLVNLAMSEKCSLKSISLQGVGFMNYRINYWIPNFLESVETSAQRKLVNIVILIGSQVVKGVECSDFSDVLDFQSAIYSAVSGLWSSSSACHSFEESSGGQMSDMMSRFLYLQELSLDVCCFSDALLYELADTAKRQCRLKLLQLRLTDTCGESLSSKAWNTLCQACPSLQVNVFSRGLRLPSTHSLRCFIKPETPVNSVNVNMHMGYLPQSQIGQMLQEHSCTLTRLSYSVYGLGGRSAIPGRVGDVALVSLALLCPRLKELDYSWRIHYQDIMDIARMDRRWRVLKFFERNVQVTRGRTRTDEETRLKCIEELNMRVSRCVQFPWSCIKSLGNAERFHHSILKL